MQHNTASSNVLLHNTAIVVHILVICYFTIYYRRLLAAMRDGVLAAFTGTPIPREPEDGRRLLDIVKGRGADGEGHIW